MTPLELKTLDIVREAIATTGIAPTTGELERALGLRSRSGVKRLLDALVAHRALDRLPHRARGLSLVGQPLLQAAPTEALLAEIERRKAA